VRCTRDDDGGVSIAVIDQGEGISDNDQPRIFEEFVQVSPSQQPGTGLGLPISRRLATLLDGSLEVTSEPGRGSTFTLRLPPEGTARVYETDDVSAGNPAGNGVQEQTENTSKEVVPQGARVA